MAKITSLLGLRIKNRLEDIKETQTWLAGKLGLSNNAISKWVSGDSEPKFSNLIDLAKHLKCSVGYLVGDFEDESISEVVRLMESVDKNTRAKALLGVIVVLGTTPSESRSIKKATSSQ